MLSAPPAPADVAPMEYQKQLLERRSVVGQFGVTALLAAAFIVGSNARIASGIVAPAPSTHLQTILEQTAMVLAIVVGLTRRRVSQLQMVRPALVATTVALCTIICWNVAFGFSHVDRTTLTHVAEGGLLFVAVVRGFAYMTPRQIGFVLAPLFAITAVSVGLWFINHNRYLFPWYNTWGLIAALLVGAICGLQTRITKRWSLAAAICIVAVLQSTSRQAMLAVVLIVVLLILRSANPGQRFKRLSIFLSLAFVGYVVISSTKRFAELGGVTSSNGRGSLLSSAWKAIQTSPWTGISADKFGGGSFQQILLTIGNGWSNSSHNFFLDSWLRAGVAAFGLAVILGWMVIRSERKSAGWAFSYSGIAALPFLMFGSQLLFYDNKEAAIALGLFVALSNVCVQHSRRGRDERR